MRSDPFRQWKNPGLVNLALYILLVFAGPTLLFAQTLKIGTIAPPGSPWEESLLEIASEWDRISNGRVKLRIYAGSVGASEADLVRKMRIGQLQGASLTQVALAGIVPDILSLATPFLIRDDDEYEYVIEGFLPALSDGFRQKGFEFLNWSTAGWVHFFGSQSIHNPGDLRRMNLAVPADDADMLQIFRALGFKAFALSIPEYIVGLETGMVNSFFAPPLVVVAFQWFGFATHMCVLPVTPVFGANIVTSKAWETIPQELRPALAEAARKAGESLSAETAVLDAQAIVAMQERGLIVDEVGKEDLAEWRTLADEGITKAFHSLVSPEAIERLRALLAEYRNSAD